MAQDYGQILKWTAVLAGGFIAVRVALYVKDEIAKGAKAADALAGAAKKVVTQDLNPTSPENLAYKAANAVTGGDSSQPLGARVFEFFHKDENATMHDDTMKAQAAKAADDAQKATDAFAQSDAVYAGTGTGADTMFMNSSGTLESASSMLDLTINATGQSPFQ